MTKPPKRSITQMQELADLAGVSRATVSRALSDSSLVNPKTKEKIRKLAIKHNYKVNTAARNFRLRKTNVIAVVFMLDIKSEQHMSDPFFLEMLGGIADCLAEHDYDLYLAHAPISNILYLKDSRLFQQSDGVIFIGQADQHEHLNTLANSDTPIVVWGADLPNRTYCLVGGDNSNGAFLATQHLVDSGRKKIAFFGDISLPEVSQRFEGYLKALKDNELEIDKRIVVNVPFEMEHAHNAIGHLLANKVSFDAVVCSSDVMALSAITTFNEHGYSVPKNIAVVGYDNITLASYSNPPLTTISQDIRRAGRVLVESLLSIIRQEVVADTMLKSELVIRKSSG